jgi:hypothetical protein
MTAVRVTRQHVHGPYGRTSAAEFKAAGSGGKGGAMFG